MKITKVHKKFVCHSGPERIHPDHSCELGRLNRIIGQLEGIKKMISDRRYCPEIIVQSKAATSAINALSAAILRTHLESCVRETLEFRASPAKRDEQISELIDLFLKR